MARRALRAADVARRFGALRVPDDARWVGALRVADDAQRVGDAFDERWQYSGFVLRPSVDSGFGIRSSAKRGFALRSSVDFGFVLVPSAKRGFISCPSEAGNWRQMADRRTRDPCMAEKRTRNAADGRKTNPAFPVGRAGVCRWTVHEPGMREGLKDDSGFVLVPSAKRGFVFCPSEAGNWRQTAGRRTRNPCMADRRTRDPYMADRRTRDPCMAEKRTRNAVDGRKPNPSCGGLQVAGPETASLRAGVGPHAGATPVRQRHPRGTAGDGATTRGPFGSQETASLRVGLLCGDGPARKRPQGDAIACAETAPR